MKICYVTMQFPVPSETFLSLDVEALRSQGHDISVYALRPTHPDFLKMMAERGHAELEVKHFSFRSVFLTFWIFFRNINVAFSLLFWVILNCYRAPRHLLKSFLLIPSSLCVFYYIHRRQPDVVHLFWGHYPSMVGFLVKKYMPNIVLSHFLGAHDLVQRYPGSKKLSQVSDVMITHSKSNISILEDFGIFSSPVNVVHRGTKLDFPVEGTLEKYSFINNPVFLTAARLIKEKGVDDVLKVFSSIYKENDKAKLYIAGEGPFKAELVDQAKRLGCADNVEFCGHLNQVKLLELMSEAHFFLLMSCYPAERLPNVIKEAMYQQCVVITTDTDGISELVSHEVSGVVVEKKDYKSALSHVELYLSRPDLAMSLAVKAKQKIINDFNVDRSMRCYADLWESAMQRKFANG